MPPFAWRTAADVFEHFWACHNCVTYRPVIGGDHSPAEAHARWHGHRVVIMRVHTTEIEGIKVLWLQP